MKRLEKIVISVTVFVMMLVTGGVSVPACTGIYVGREASDDGTVMIARSNDTQGVMGNHITITERVEGKSGRRMQVDMEGSTYTDIPATTYRYTVTPLLESTYVANKMPIDATAGSNEYGVTMTMSITAFSNDDALAADPFVETGLTENAAVDLVLCQSRTAREAVDVVLSLVDRYGNREGSIVLIADREEAWYVEIYTGHQYAAVLLPEDKVCVFGNEFTMEYLSDFKESIVSKELETLPQKHGFAVYGKGKELNLLDTYSGERVATDYCHMRTWIGHQVLAPSVFHDDYELSAKYPLCFTPDDTVSLSDVCSLLRNRFEGTKYDPDKTGRIDMRVIGSDTSRSVHVLQVFPTLPAEMSAVIWECTGPAVYGVFVPVSNASLSVSEAYGRDQSFKDANVFDTENYPYYAFKELNTLCMGSDNYEVYGAPVRAHWASAEKKMFDTMQKVLFRASLMKDGDDPKEYITRYCNEVQDRAFEDAKQLVNDVVWAQSANSNTMKLAKDPVTDKYIDKERVLEPMKVSVDPSGYEKIPGRKIISGGNLN